MPELTGRYLEQIEAQLHAGRFTPSDFRQPATAPASAGAATAG